MQPTLGLSVGASGVNQFADVVRVQYLLNEVSAKKDPCSAIKLIVDGVAGPMTVAAISKFQNAYVSGYKGSPGRIEPNGATISKLNTLAGFSPPLTDGVHYRTVK